VDEVDQLIKDLNEAIDNFNGSPYLLERCLKVIVAFKIDKEGGKDDSTI